MGRLKEIAIAFERLCQYDYEYELSSGKILKLSMDKSNLPHLIGLHKLIDIEILRKLAEKRVSGSEVYRKTKREIITDEEVFSSSHFYKISDRFNHIGNIENLLFDRVVLDFDKSKLSTSIQSKILMYKKIDDQYVHLGLVLTRNGSYAPETLIVQNDEYYINNQIELDINKLTIKRRGSIVDVIDYANNINEEVATTKNNIDES